MHDDVETKVAILEITAECAVTDLRKDGSGEVDTDYALDFPHQVGANSEPSDLAAYGRVIRLVKIVSAAQPHIRIEPVIVSRDSLAEALVQSKRKLIRDSRLRRINYAVDSVPAGDAPRHERIYACLQNGLFLYNKILDPLSHIFFNVPGQRTDWNFWFTLVAV